jgi:cob(I)alamin adenosyltransferase
VVVKIYTRAGDAGETGLLGGRRVRKSIPRVAAYGEVDELNASLGVVRAALADQEIGRLLGEIQCDLFALGAQIADARPEAVERTPKAVFAEAKVTSLERAIDRAEAGLAPLRQFILPGGCEAAARLHLARTVCRRAERRVVALAEQEEIAPAILAYLNRLSDLLFVLARLVNQRAGSAEIPW